MAGVQRVKQESSGCQTSHSLRALSPGGVLLREDPKERWGIPPGCQEKGQSSCGTSQGQQRSVLHSDGWPMGRKEEVAGE